MARKSRAGRRHHNVVGGLIGVFEGNGGDLRIGLSRQSLNDGARWMHAPLRLSVMIDAPVGAIDRHEALRQLLDNRWVHLLAIEGGNRTFLFFGIDAKAPRSADSELRPAVPRSQAAVNRGRRPRRTSSVVSGVA